jgi:hypothetical protein
LYDSVQTAVAGFGKSMQREFQDFKERFLVFEEGKPHQKFLKDLSNWLQMLLGIKKELMA